MRRVNIREMELFVLIALFLGIPILGYVGNRIVPYMLNKIIDKILLGNIVVALGGNATD